VQKRHCAPTIRDRLGGVLGLVGALHVQRVALPLPVGVGAAGGPGSDADRRSRPLQLRRVLRRPAEVRLDGGLHGLHPSAHLGQQRLGQQVLLVLRGRVVVGVRWSSGRWGCGGERAPQRCAAPAA